MSKLRILFYCHNLFGLGHIRRSIRLAAACADQGAVCQVVTGCRSLEALDWDSRIGLERLPAVEVGPDHLFHEAGHPESTGVMEQRSTKIREVCREFAPEQLVVDYLPGGLGGELLPLGEPDSPLQNSCRVVWGVPYTKRISRPVSRPRNPRIRRWMDRFDAVLAYTDREWEDPLPPLEVGGLPELRCHTGFITGVPAETDASSQKVVVLAGGGREAIQMAPLIKKSLKKMVEAGRISLRCVVGPLGDVSGVRDKLGRIAEIVPAASVEDAVHGATVVISRCGYNSSYTLLRSTAPIVFLPQISPCYEQLDRAAGFESIERVTVVREDAEKAAEDLFEAVSKALQEPHRARNLPFSVDGDRVTADWLLKVHGSSC